MQEPVSAEYNHKGNKHHSEHYTEHTPEYYPEHHHEPRLTQVRHIPPANASHSLIGPQVKVQSGPSPEYRQ
jgi:hypothetical protein